MLMKISMVLALLLALTWGQSLAADLKPGDMAPEFSLPGSDGKTYSLKQFQRQAGGGAGLVSQSLHRGVNGRVPVVP